MRTHTKLSAAILLALAAGGCQQTHTAASSPVGRPADPTRPTAQAAADFDSKPTPPVDAHTHFAAGQVAESRGDVDGAATQYRAAVKLDPADAGSLYRLGMILTAERKPDAPAVWRQYVAATGGTATAYSDLGFALDLAGRPTEAEAAFQAGVARDARCEACRVNYARLLARRGHVDDATAQLSAVLTPAEVQFDLGSVLEQQGDAAAAAARYRRALELDPKLTDAQLRLAAVQ